MIQCVMQKTLSLNINKDEIKKCFEKYNKYIDFDTFKKLILDSELEDWKEYESTNGGYSMRRSSKKVLN